MEVQDCDNTWSETGKYDLAAQACDRTWSETSKYAMTYWLNVLIMHGSKYDLAAQCSDYT